MMSTPGIALLPALRELVQTLVGQQLERLVADLRKAHLRDASARGEPDCSISPTYGTSGLTTTTQLRACLDRDVEVGRRDEAAVDVDTILDLDRLVDHRDRARGGDGLRDRDVVEALGAEHDAFTGVQVGAGQIQLAVEIAEVVGRPASDNTSRT